MRVLRESGSDEMVACFLAGEISSPRFGPAIRRELAERGESEALLTGADLTDRRQNRTRRALLAATRGYGEDRDLFDGGFPTGDVRWVWALLAPEDLARVRYVEYSYWNELSGGSRLPVDAARRIHEGVEVFGVSNRRFVRAAEALARGERFPPLILAGPRSDELVCLEGHLRLTAHALVGFPTELECLVGTHPALARWAR